MVAVGSDLEVGRVPCSSIIRHHSKIGRVVDTRFGSKVNGPKAATLSTPGDFAIRVEARPSPAMVSQFDLTMVRRARSGPGISFPEEVEAKEPDHVRQRRRRRLRGRRLGPLAPDTSAAPKFALVGKQFAAHGGPLF